MTFCRTPSCLIIHFPQVLTNVVGALGECAKVSSNRDVIKRSNGIQPLVNLLKLTNPELLENVTKVLGECAKDMACMEEIQALDGVRLIWSLLKNCSQKVQANAALALSPCIQNAQVRASCGIFTMVNLTNSKPRVDQ